MAAALQSATISSANLTGAAEKLNTAWQRAHGTVSGPVISSFAGLVTSLTKVYGNTKTAEGVANAYARQMGLTAGQVQPLDVAIQGLIADLAGLHDKSFTITAHYVTTDAADSGRSDRHPGDGPAPGNPLGRGSQTGAQYAAAGVTLVGEMGPELVRFGGGEQVVPSWQTAGIMHGGGGGGEGQINLTSHNVISVSGAKVGSATRTQVLTYSRRNPSNNWALRTR